MLYIGYSSLGSAQDESSYSRPMKRRSLEAAARDAKQSKISGFFAASAKTSQPSKPSDPKDEAAESSSTTVKSTVQSTALAQNASSAVALRNGVALPVLGFGTYRLGRQAQGIVAEALKAGYRLIDTAQVYDQGSIESAVGAALRHSGLPRSSVFISTKVWRSSHGFEKTLQACQQSLKRLEVDYIDLYLVHWPGPQPSNSKAWSPQTRQETWRAMEKLLRDGKVKAIGVCNHSIRHLKDLLKSCEIQPMVNQVWLQTCSNPKIKLWRQRFNMS